MTLNESTDSIVWHLATDNMILSPRSMQRIGNLIIGSNLDTKAYEGTFNGQPAYILENEYLRVYFNKTGSSSAPQMYNTSEILLGIYHKDIKQWMPMKSIEFSIDGSALSMNGTGYTELSPAGHNLPMASVIARINTSYSFQNNYTITFSLESGADFLIIESSA